MKRSQMTINILAQLVHNPHPSTATAIKNFIELPPEYDKPTLVRHLKEALSDDSEVEVS